VDGFRRSQGLPPYVAGLFSFLSASISTIVYIPSILSSCVVSDIFRASSKELGQLPTDWVETDICLVDEPRYRRIGKSSIGVIVSTRCVFDFATKFMITSLALAD
jgi:hypothetical protein